MRAAILLAAGRSTRFGRADKLLAVVRGKPVIAHALEQAAASVAGRIVVVLGRGRPRRRHLVSRCSRVRIVYPQGATAGLSASLRAGLAALRPIEREAWIFLADMPLAGAPRRLRLRPGILAARPSVHGRPGHPLLVRVDAAKAAMPAGDRGLATALPPRSIAEWRGTSANLLDLDDRAALRAFRFRR